MQTQEERQKAWDAYAERWRYEVTDHGVHGFVARLPYRDIKGKGKTRDEAIASLMGIYIEMTAGGEFDPNNPEQEPAKRAESAHERAFIRRRAHAGMADQWVPILKNVAARDGGESGVAYEATLPFRDVVAEGSSEMEAVGALVLQYCDLARCGSINPSRPYMVGAPPLQHVLELLEEQLGFFTLLRYDDWRENVLSRENVDEAAAQDTTACGVWRDDGRFKRRNEVIGGIATAIAAIARVKEL